jgi:hypothetical protein
VIFILSSIYRKRGGGTMLMINDSDLGELQEGDLDKKMVEFDPDRVIRVAVEGLKILIQKDKQQNQVSG